MNKKQLIVIGVTALLLCLVILFAPKVYLMPHEGGYITSTKPYGRSNAPHINWNIVLKRGIVIIIVGVLLNLIFQNPLNIKVKLSKIKFNLRFKIILFVFLCVFIFIGILIFLNNMSKVGRMNKNIMAEKGIYSKKILQLEEEKREFEVKKQELETEKREFEAKKESLETEKDKQGEKIKNLWRQLRMGMSTSEVRTILGEPNRIDASWAVADVIMWYYNEGEVILDKNYRVKGWREY